MVSMIKSNPGFFQMQIKRAGRHTIEPGQPPFGITPKRFNAIVSRLLEWQSRKVYDGESKQAIKQVKSTCNVRGL